MTNQDLFKEAIADAKAIRETALANAKVALEEALAPRLQSMLAAKLQEMDNMDEAEEEKLEEKSLGQDTYRTGDVQHVGARERHAALEENEEELEEDFDLSEILAELEEAKEEEEKEKMKEAKKEEEEDEEEGEEPAESEPAESETVADLSVDELKMIIKDIISSEMEDGGMEDMGGDETEAGDEMTVDVSSDEGEGMEEDLNLEELLAELDALDEDYSEEETEYEEGGMYEAKKKAKKEDDKMKKELDEAIATIHTLRSELNEVNLLNAKLLYVNKIFKAKNLTESQKLKVIAQFDKASTVKEAKMIYETMDVAIAKSAKSSIKESMGFASKAAGVAKKPIVEVDETMSRWQMLAGIKKH